MQGLTVREITQLTGINASLWRAMIKRHELFRPMAKKGTIYYYSNEQLALILKLAFLYVNGFTLQKLITSDETALNRSIYTHLAFAPAQSCSLLLLAAGLSFNEAAFVAYIKSCVRVFGLEKTIIEIYDAYLTRINQVSPSTTNLAAQKPFALPIITQQLVLYTTDLAATRPGHKIILFTAEAVESEIKPLLINYLLRRKGIEVIYLSPSAGLSKLKKIVAREQADTVWIFYPAAKDTFTADTYLEQLVRQMPHCRFVATGPGIQNVSRNFLAVKLLRKDRDIYDYIESS